MAPVLHHSDVNVFMFIPGDRQSGRLLIRVSQLVLENMIGVLLFNAPLVRSMENSRDGGYPMTPGSRGSRGSLESRDQSEDAAFQFGTQNGSRGPRVSIHTDQHKICCT